MATRSTAKDEPFPPFDDDDFTTEPDEVTYDDLTATLPRDEAPALPDNAPQPAPPTASEQPLPEWRKYHPAQSHTIEWADAETPSIRHSHTVYADKLDEVLVQVRQVKAVVQAAQAKAKFSRPAAQQSGGTEAQGDGTQGDTRMCRIHDEVMTQRMSQKTGKPYFAHSNPSGRGLCFGRAEDE